jgi:hypothetical protein
MLNCRAALQKMHCLFQLFNGCFHASKKAIFRVKTFNDSADQCLPLATSCASSSRNINSVCKNDVVAFRGERLDCERSPDLRIGVQKYARRWVPHSLGAAHNKHPRLSTIELFNLSGERQSFDFNGFTIKDESWFLYHYESQEMFAPSREQVAPHVRTKLGVQEVMSTVFFTSTMLAINETSPKGRKFTHDYFIFSVLP